MCHPGGGDDSSRHAWRRGDRAGGGLQRLHRQAVRHSLPGRSGAQAPRRCRPLTSRVLIVDDEPANVLLLESMLADQSELEIKTVTDSAMAEREFMEFEPDIVLLDLHMPKPDGIEILTRLRGPRSSLGFLPVIVLTADTTRVARNSALLLGADDFLIKPLDREEVVLRVRNLLRTRGLYRELAAAKEALEQHERPST